MSPRHQDKALQHLLAQQISSKAELRKTAAKHALVVTAALAFLAILSVLGVLMSVPIIQHNA